MMRFLRRGTRLSPGLLLVLCAVLAIAQGRAAGTASIKLAVWGAPEQRDASAALIAELARSSDDYAVLEREQLERVAGEQAFHSREFSFEQAIQAGRLLGADGVLWVESVNVQGRPAVVTRLSATQSGVVIGWQVDAAPLPDPAGWARLVRTRIDGWRAKLGISRDRAVPISILDLRGATDSAAAVATGQTLKTLLGARLTVQPELFVLERWRLDEMAWENMLAGAAASGFWNGAWLLDGSITEAAGEVELNMRLRGSDGREMRWTRKGRDAVVLVGEIATDVMERIDVRAPAAPWDQKAEAKEFVAEAEWAARWKLDARALESSEAAIALGENSVATQRLRYLACSRLALSAPGNLVARMGLVNGWERSSQSYAMPELVRIERSLRAIALYNDFRRTAAGAGLSALSVRQGYMQAGMPGYPWGVSSAEADTAKLLGNTACILWTAYYAKQSGGAEVDAALARLRAEARALFERELAALALDFQPRAPDRLPSTGGGGRAYPVQLDNLPLVGFVHGALWAERCMDHELLAKKILGSQITGEGGVYDDALATLSSMRWQGWGVDWQSHDERIAHENWERFARGLLKEDRLGLQVAGAMWLLSLRDWPVPGEDAGFEKKWRRPGRFWRSIWINSRMVACLSGITWMRSVAPTRT